MLLGVHRDLYSLNVTCIFKVAQLLGAEMVKYATQVLRKYAGL